MIDQKLVSLVFNAMDIQGDREAFLASEPRNRRKSLRVQVHFLGHVLEDHVVSVSVWVRGSAKADVHITRQLGLYGQVGLGSSSSLRGPVVAQPGGSSSLLLEKNGRVVKLSGGQAAVSTLPIVALAITITGGDVGEAVSSAVVHRDKLSGTDRAVILLGPVTLERGCPVSCGVGGDHVLEELVGRRIIVSPVGDEMAGLRHAQPTEIIARAVVASSSVGFVGLIIEIVYLASLSPEGTVVRKTDASDSFF